MSAADPLLPVRFVRGESLPGSPHGGRGQRRQIGEEYELFLERLLDPLSELCPVRLLSQLLDRRPSGRLSLVRSGLTSCCVSKCRLTDGLYQPGSIHIERFGGREEELQRWVRSAVQIAVHARVAAATDLIGMKLQVKRPHAAVAQTQRSLQSSRNSGCGLHEDLRV
jgi:hypothetical protein